MKVMPHIFFSGPRINSCIMGTSLTNLRLFSHNVSFIINALFPPLHEMLYWGCIKLFAEMLKLITQACFSSLLSAKCCPGSTSFRGPKRQKS